MAGPAASDYRELGAALRRLRLRDRPAIAHTSMKSIGMVKGGPDALLGALLGAVSALVVPTFTYKTMVVPDSGPPNNGITYGSGKDHNRLAEPFHIGMPADKLMGVLPETLRRHPNAVRTSHPILSFAGVNADAILAAQTRFNPLAPIGALADADGWVLLLGVDHTVNTSIHYAERRAGRRQFVRWALTTTRIGEYPGFPGCSLGFQAISADLAKATRSEKVGGALVQAVSLRKLFDVVQARLKDDPLALLCDQTDCERCAAVRGSPLG